MVAVAFVLLWGGYSLGNFGWCLFRDYDITLGQLMSPTHPYAGAWPPAKIPAGQIWPGGAAASSSSSAASKAEAGESVFSKIVNIGKFLP